MELIIGPSLALIVSMFFATASGKKNESQIAELEIKVEKLEMKLVGYNKAVDLKLIQTMAPVAQAVKALNEQVGI